MYARDLMYWLHERLGDRGAFDLTQKRFESLRGYGLLPRGRENAGVRLSGEQIANAVLGFCHPLPGFAGHASLILGDLRPVGGLRASYRGATQLSGEIAKLIEEGDPKRSLSRLTLSVERDFKGDEYAAVLYSKVNDQTKTVSYVSKYALRLCSDGSEEGYDHEQLNHLAAVQRSLGSEFFQNLSRDVAISRQLDRPLRTDWREYESEEEREEFHRRLGARRSSRFMNLRVDAHVTWPKEPTRINFGGHNFVLFPKTAANSHSISIDIQNERISEDAARSLINRLLSLMSWCEDRPSSLHEGWIGNPVPVPVSRLNLGSMTMNGWLFYRTLPENRELLMCLAYYRDGLNAYSVGLASHAVLSFFRVFEVRYDTRKKVIEWINNVFATGFVSPGQGTWDAFELEQKAQGVSVGEYVYVHCRVAAAHAAKDAPSDPDETAESRRLLNGSEIIRELARHFIREEFRFSTSYLTDEPD